MTIARRNTVGIGSWLPYLLTALSIWLAWQVVQSFVALRAPPEMAIRVAPGSPEALRRVAEAELAAGDAENARFVAVESLRRAPFQARALRVAGLADAGMERMTLADQELTLAGNWSLRDTPAHAWLVERRLRRGNYVSSFAHADTIARRDRNASNSIFPLFRVAATTDPRAVGPLLDLLARRPIWRQDFLDTLYADEVRGPQLLALIATGLEKTPGRLNDVELAQLYGDWLRAGRIQGLQALRDTLGRPPVRALVADGSFAKASELPPFTWMLGAGPGLIVEITSDELQPDNTALWVQSDAFLPAEPAKQLIGLAPGTYTLKGRFRLLSSSGVNPFVWTVNCLETGAVAGRWTAPERRTDNWAPLEGRVEIPSSGCSVQWLTLKVLAGERRTDVVAWFDDFAITPE